MRFRHARAAPSWRHSVRTLWKGTARARGRRSFGARPVLSRACPAPHRARWFARVARLRATAIALSLGTRPSTCPSDARARRAKPVTLGPYTTEGHCTSGRPPFLRRQVRAPTRQRCLSLRVVCCVCGALARHCARSLWGQGLARALPTRARAAPSWRHSDYAPWNDTTQARSRRSFGARPVLPRASPASHRARWLARVARLRASAIALCWDEAQHVRLRRVRAPRQVGVTLPTQYGRALHEREAAVPSAPGPCFHVPALPLTARGGLRV